MPILRVASRASGGPWDGAEAVDRGALWCQTRLTAARGLWQPKRQPVRTGRRLPGAFGLFRAGLHGPYTQAPLRITGTASPDGLIPSISTSPEPIIQSMWIAEELPPRRLTSSLAIVSPP